MELLELADKLFTGELPIEAHHPFASSGQMAEVQPGLAFVDAFANSAAVDTDDGLVVVDTSGVFHAQAVHDTIRTWSGRPLHTAVFTHGHIDHVFGVDLYEAEARTNGWPTPRVDRARGHRRALRALPHDRGLQRGDQPAAVQGAGSALADRVPHARRDVPRRAHRSRSAARRSSCSTTAARPTTRRGCGRRRGKVLFAGDMFIWASPNCGNPQKVQRYARDWAIAFRKMVALEPEVLLPGHGLPIIGADRVQRALDRGRGAARVVGRTDARADERRRAPRRHRARRARAGASARTAVPARGLRRARVRRAQPVAALRRLVRRRSVAPEARARGRARRARSPSWPGARRGSPTRALEVAAAGDMRLAGHLAELAAQAAPDDPGVHAARAEVFGARAARRSVDDVEGDLLVGRTRIAGQSAGDRDEGT